MPHPDDATAADETRQYVSLGTGNVEEDFSIPCYIDCFAGGKEASEHRPVIARAAI